MREKRPYVGFRVETWYCSDGTVQEKRVYVGETWAVSEERARANLEYRDRGNALYAGSLVEEYAGNERDVHYEVVCKW